MDPKVARAQLERMKAPEGLDPRRENLNLWALRFGWDRPTNSEAYRELAATDPRRI
jgi:hypothetical protein